MLVVEDEPALRAMYRAALEIDGFTVVAVEDGLDALRRIETGAPAAVVLDLGLPRLGGRDVYREMAANDHTRGIPIVIVTGQDTRDLNPDEFACILHKPLDPQDLLSAVRQCVQRAPL